MRSPVTIAVVGSGISGLSAAWLLSKAYDVTLFEADDRIGGHSHTVETVTRGAITPVDTGFIVYNTHSYPNLIALFEHLGVETTRSNMSFSVSLDDGAYEYSGTGFQGVFGQPRNLVSPQHWRMLADIRRFFTEAPDVLKHGLDTEQTLGEFLRSGAYGPAFIERHIVPMAAAIWSAPVDRVLAFPMMAFVRFFANHGLLQVRNRPEWRTVVGGSRTYVRRLVADMSGRVVSGSAVKSLQRTPKGVVVTTNDRPPQTFDACVLATHADQALTLLADACQDEHALLSAFTYQNNHAVLHTDPIVMPRRRRIWSSWNFQARSGARSCAPSVTYWMNRLQPLGTAQDLFVTLNPIQPIAAERRRAAIDYSHPVFDTTALRAQRRLWTLQGKRNTWYCGSYFGYGFHEDGLQSGLAVAEAIGGVRRPWSVANESGRIHIGTTPEGMMREAAE